MQDKLIWVLIGVVGLCVSVLAAAAVIVSLTVPSAPEPQPSATSEGLALAVPYETYSGCVQGIYDATGEVSESDHYDCADDGQASHAGTLTECLAGHGYALNPNSDSALYAAALAACGGK